MSKILEELNVRNWNCEIVPQSDLPRDVADFCQRIDSVVIRVPIRTSGLTSSGKIGECYLNVNIMTKLFGGSGVVGWVLVRDTDDILRNQSATSAVLLGHAIWLNGEDKASCVTAKSWGMGNGVYRKGGKTYFDFVLWGVNEKPSPTFLRDLWFKKSDCDSGYEITWAGEKRMEGVRPDELDRGFASKRLVNFAISSLWEIVEERVMRTRGVVRGTRALIKHSEDCGGGFTEKSVATGKTYQSIKRDRIKRLAPA
jgi:hypothetical protein